MFYEVVVASAILYVVMCYGSRLSAADYNRLNKRIHKASNAVGVEPGFLTEVSEKRMLSKLWSELDNPSHPLHFVLNNNRSMFSKNFFHRNMSEENIFQFST